MKKYIGSPPKHGSFHWKSEPLQMTEDLFLDKTNLLGRPEETLDFPS